LVGILEAKLGIPNDPDIVLLALAELESADLLEKKDAIVEPELPSRRQIGRKLAMAGLSASLVPVIASVLAPTPAMASSPGTGITSGKYKQDLDTINTDISRVDTKVSWHSHTARNDYLKGVVSGDQGPILRGMGNTSAAGNDFQVAQNDFDGILKVLGLPPL
jgi:hypothetical protein